MTGHWEWIVVLVVALLLFGKRLPEVMRAMGKGVSEFKKGLREAEDEVESAGKGSGSRTAGELPQGRSDSHPSPPAG